MVITWPFSFPPLAATLVLLPLLPVLDHTLLLEATLIHGLELAVAACVFQEFEEGAEAGVYWDAGGLEGAFIMDEGIVQGLEGIAVWIIQVLDCIAGGGEAGVGVDQVFTGAG